MDKVNCNSKISTIDKTSYGIGNFSTGVAMQVIGTYLVFYTTAILCVPGSLVGLAVSISVIWDAVTDPIMGYISDITHSRIFGRRHLNLIIGSIGIAVTNYFIWNINASYGSNIKFMLIFISFVNGSRYNRS